MIDVLLFAKAPRPGLAKTRLAATVGDTQALAVYRSLGERVVRQIRRVSHITVWYDPPDALSEMQEWLGEEREYRPQGAGDLGARLHAAFDAHFATHPGAPAVAIGVDTPDLDAETLTAAVAALHAADVVLGPAVDGGYYLLGLTAPQPTLLKGIPWGTDRVFAVTRERCDALGVTTHVLPALRDVDTEEDAVAMGLIALDH